MGLITLNSKEMEIKFQGFTCTLEKANYENGRVALFLNDVVDGQMVAKCSVNVPDKPLEEDEVFIKTYGENYGMLRTLIEAGVVAPPHKFETVMFNKLPVCKILI